jgi:uncharacterized protein (DUF58 family)
MVTSGNRRVSVYLLLMACLGAGLFTGRAFFFNLAYLFGGLLALSWVWAWLSVSGVVIGRQTRTRRAQVGKTLDEFFTVRNRGLVPKLWLEVRDHSNMPGHNPSVVTPTLMPGVKFPWTVNTPCLLRGEFTLGPMTVIGGDPFGFFQMTRRIAATSDILVYPLSAPIYDFAPPAGLQSGGDARRQRTHYVTTNAAGVRDYAPGDSYNRIHWKSSARRDKLLVKEFELDPVADVWVLLDLSITALYERPYSVEGVREMFIPPSSAEYSIAVAASLAEYFLVKERALGLAAYTPRRVVLQPDRGVRQLARVLETLARARPESETTFAQLLATESAHLGRGATAVLITADPNEAWISEAHMLARRGVRTVAVVVDARSFGDFAVAHTADEVRGLLEMGGVFTYLVRQNDDLTRVLSGRR